MRVHLEKGFQKWRDSGIFSGQNDIDLCGMMEIFIVLGLCFVFYEALDIFQGCYHQYYQRHTGHITSGPEDGSFNSDDVEECSDTKHLLATSGECDKDSDWEKSGKFIKPTDRYFLEDERECHGGETLSGNNDKCTIFSVSECLDRENELSTI